MNEETKFVITESELQNVLRSLGECPHKYVHTASAILVSLPELVQENRKEPEDNELLEG